jgi:PLP dependent protein
MIETDQISENLQQVHAAIATACARANRVPSDVTLIAVTKTQPAEVVRRGVAAGLQHFGENRVEEASVKIPELNQQMDSPLVWHMIGHIQSRKARLIPPLFQMAHSIDSLKLARKLSRWLAEQNATFDVLLEMNVSGEASKSGFAAADWAENQASRDLLRDEIKQLLALPGLNVRGLMMMAPFVSDTEQVRPLFTSLAALREALADSFGVAFPELSMGMTNDYPVAIEEGATMIRVGRAIFGERQK